MELGTGGNQGPLTNRCCESGEKEGSGLINLWWEDYRGSKKLLNGIAGFIDARSRRGRFEVGNPFANPDDDLVADPSERLQAVLFRTGGQRRVIEAPVDTPRVPRKNRTVLVWRCHTP